MFFWGWIALTYLCFAIFCSNLDEDGLSKDPFADDEPELPPRNAIEAPVIKTPWDPLISLFLQRRDLIPFYGSGLDVPIDSWIGSIPDDTIPEEEVEAENCPVHGDPMDFAVDFENLSAIKALLVKPLFSVDQIKSNVCALKLADEGPSSTSNWMSLTLEGSWLKIEINTYRFYHYLIYESMNEQVETIEVLGSGTYWLPIGLPFYYIVAETFVGQEDLDGFMELLKSRRMSSSIYSPFIYAAFELKQMKNS